MFNRSRPASDIEKAVEYFITAKSRQKFKGNDELISALECIEEAAVSTGLSPLHITSLVDVAADGLQVETVCKRIIKALIPHLTVPEEAVLKCISWICTRKPSINIQCLLLRWILVIYDYIDTKNELHGLYGVLFHFLHYRTLMPYICHLLYLLTRKEDVRLFRVRFLIQYQKDMGPQAYLTGLLSIYRHYYPSLVHVANTRSYKSFFPSYDRKWISLVCEVREKNGVPQTVDTSWEKALLERLNPSGKIADLMPSKKRRKIDPIPVIHSLTSKSSYKRDTLAHTLGLQTVPFVLIHSFKCVLDNLENIEFPSQIGAVLRSDALKHVMSYTKDHIACARFQFWISKTLQEELVDTMKQNNKQRVTSLLQTIKLFSEFLQEGIPAVDVEISDYLQNWNGVHYSTLIFKLVSRCRMYSFPMFYDGVLEPLRKLFFSSSVYGKCKIVMCLTDLLRNHAANEWPRSLEKSEDNSCEYLFSQDKENIDGVDAMQNIVKFVSKLCLAACISENRNMLFEMCVLDFLDLVSNLHKHYNLPFVLLVDPRLMERLLISGHALTVTRVCTVLCRYKENFDLLRAGQKAGDVTVINSKVELSVIRLCNQLVIDFCNTLWRFKPFSSNDTRSLFCWQRSDVDKENRETELTVDESLSLFQHPAFLPYTVRFIEENQLNLDIKFGELRSMKKDYLNHLDRHQLTGLAQFIATFVRNKTTAASKTQMMGFSQLVTTPNKSSQLVTTPNKSH